MSVFKGIGIWPFNLMDMDSKIDPNTIYTLQNQSKEEEEPKQEDCETNWIKHKATQKFINIGSTIEVPIDNLFKDQPKFYVDMPIIPIITNHASIIESKNMVENFAQPSLDETIQLKNYESSIQVALTQVCHDLLSLPHFSTRRTNGRKPLVDYSQSHVVTLETYLKIMR